MDNTQQQYALAHSCVLDLRINQAKSKQVNALYIVLFTLKNSYLQHVSLVFCVLPLSTVLPSPKITAPFLPKEHHHG